MPSEVNLGAVDIEFFPSFIVHFHKLIRLGKADKYLPSSSAALIKVTDTHVAKFPELADVATVIVRYKEG